MRQRWESLRLELKTKLQLLQKTLEQDHKQPVQSSVCPSVTMQQIYKYNSAVIACCSFYFFRFSPDLLV